MSTEGQSLVPPTSELTLAPPEPVAAVAPQKAAGMVPIDAAALPALDEKVAAYVDSILALDVHSPAFSQKAADVRQMGDADIKASADTSNRLLSAPVRAMQHGPLTEGAKVATSLMDLRHTIEDLDPKHAGSHKFLAKLPFGDKLRDYFQRYESAQAHLDAIVKALYDGQDELRKDNAGLEQEKLHLWETMQRLTQYAYVAEHLDAALVTKIAEIEASDPDKAKTLREDVLFYARQKHQDLLTQLAVSIQGYLAIDLVKRNNVELIKGVDRATSTTIAALRTAVIVAQALSNQKLVLDQIDALNTTTSSLIESTSRLLATQSVEINKQAAASTVSLDALKSAFQNVYQSMDAIDTFKVQALDSMAQTVSALKTEIDGAQGYLSRVQAADARSADDTTAGALDLNPKT